MRPRRLELDPRTKLVLLIVVNVGAFTATSIYFEAATVILLALLLTACGCPKLAAFWLVLFGTLVGIQFFILPHLPGILVSPFFIMAVFARKVLPCGMVGTLILKTTSVRSMVIALSKWHVPRTFLIPLAVTVRYFPALREEHAHIRDAMKLREINGLLKRFKFTYLSLLSSASQTADELSAAAITRGIENPAPKTSVLDLRFHAQDYACMVLATVFLASMLTTRYGLMS